ncbi:hypothetical protein CKA38_04995 [Ereboglobus luteus]|uniref:Uncharacterized protein n=1 Tax=Ereboglobus luteus TaxID=1796921 RepID=A0A2U8E1N1_9BACT|nr:hypothetical protein CKA38_04995 [Ereboglobus luteus]
MRRFPSWKFSALNFGFSIARIRATAISKSEHQLLNSKSSSARNEILPSKIQNFLSSCAQA